MKRLLTSLLLLLLVPASAGAQEGTIRYHRAIKRAFEVPEGLPEALRASIPTETTADMLLHFSPTESLMLMAPAAPSVTEGGDRAAAVMVRLKMSAGSRVDNETILSTWVRFADGQSVETREFMGRTFRIADQRPAYAWKLTGEQNQFLGRAVQKATAVHDGVLVEAWFTPEIPVAGGPGLYGGLPGMIMAVSVDSGRVVYSATEVTMGAVAAGLIKAPGGDGQVTRAAYEQTVAEKLEEIAAQRGSRGAQPTGDKRPPR